MKNEEFEGEMGIPNKSPLLRRKYQGKKILKQKEVKGDFQRGRKGVKKEDVRNIEYDIEIEGRKTKKLRRRVQEGEEKEENDRDTR